MTKRMIKFTAALLIIAFMLTGCNLFSPKGGEKWTLKIDGTEIESTETRIYTVDSGKLMMISLVDVLTHYGFLIEWESDTQAQIRNGNATYTLNTEELSLCRAGDTVNILTMHDGVYDYHYQGSTRDAVLNTTALEYVMSELGIALYARSFKDDQRAYILTRLTPEERAKYNLVINGERSRLDGAFTYPDHNGVTVYPLIEVLTLCGIDVRWKGETEAVVKMGLKKYTVSLQDSTVKRLGKEVELDLAGGDPATVYQQAKDGDLYCSSFIIRALIEEMGQQIFLFDLDEATYIIIKE